MKLKGFSLTEILIVIAIIAILAAILFPVFHSAREKGRQAKCMSNMHQLGTAFELYSSDYNEMLPAPGGLVGDYNYWDQSGDGGLNAYVRQSGVDSIWCCPNLKHWSGKYRARTYTMNSYLRSPSDVEYPTSISILKSIKLKSIQKPTETILLFEGNPLKSAYINTSVYYIYRCANWSWAKGYSDYNAYSDDAGEPWHNTVNNYLYCDGHVTARTPGKKTQGTLSTYDEMYEWYVNKESYPDKYKKWFPNDKEH